MKTSSAPEALSRNVAGSRSRLTAGVALVAGVALLVAALAVTVRIEEPRVQIEWAGAMPDDMVRTLELRYRLVDRQRLEQADARLRGNVWSYRLADGSNENVARIFNDRRIASVVGMDRAAGPPLTRLRLTWRDARDWSDARQPQSLISLTLAIVLIAASRVSSRFVRVCATVGIVAGLLAAAIAMPLDQPIRMGDSGTYTASRRSFDMYMGSQSVRFEAHLSSTLLSLIDRRLGATDHTPGEAFRILSQLAAGWYAAMLLVATWSGGWSPALLRYAGLCVAAPVTLLYFGYRELGYLSLNAAVFPLIAAGLGGARGRFETGCALAGVGAALHGFGLLSLAGAAVASFVARVRASERLRFVSRAFVIGTSAYLIWIFVYVVGMGLSVVPGHAGALPWRPLLMSTLAEYRVNDAILSARGAAEILVAGWMVGVPLIALVPAAVRRRGVDVRLVLTYALPSMVFLVAFWPIQGLAVDADLVFAAFPAVFALIWLAAQSSATTWIAFALLATGHVVFWRAMLSDVFVNARVY